MPLLAEISAVAIAAKPELYLLILGMGIVLRYAYKQFKDSQESNANMQTQFMAAIKEMDEKGEKRADSVAQMADNCHAHSLAMLGEVRVITAAQSEAMARCTRAMETGEQMLAQCAAVIKDQAHELRQR